MDQGTLVDLQIKDGQRLLERLAEEGVAVPAAAWVKEGESGRWVLYLVTPLVDSDGVTRVAYRRVNAVLRQMPQPFWVDPLMEVKVVGPDSPVGKALRDLRRRYPGPSPIPYRESRLGDLSVEGAYVYPPVPAPVGSGATEGQELTSRRESDGR
jgi:hypothetical protein